MNFIPQIVASSGRRGITITDVPAQGVAGVPISGVRFSLSEGITHAYAGLRAQHGDEHGVRHRVSCEADELPVLVVEASGLYDVALYDKSSGGNLLASNGPIAVAAAPVVPSVMFNDLPELGVVGMQLAGSSCTLRNCGVAWVCLHVDGVDVLASVGRVQVGGGINLVGDLRGIAPGRIGRFTVRAYNAPVSGVLVGESRPFPVAQGELFNVPVKAVAGRSVGGSYAATGAEHAFACLHSEGEDVGARVKVIGTQPDFPPARLVPLIPPRVGTFTVRLYAAETGALLLVESRPILVGPAPVVLHGLPATLAAGQPLSCTRFGLNSATVGASFVLFDLMAEREEGRRWAAADLGGRLELLVPQRAGLYSVRAFSTDLGEPLLLESAPINVTPAPGELPAEVDCSTVSTVAATLTSATVAWDAAPGASAYLVEADCHDYRVGGRARPIVRARVCEPTFTLAGLHPRSSAVFRITPANANGFGPTTDLLRASTAA